MTYVMLDNEYLSASEQQDLLGRCHPGRQTHQRTDPFAGRAFVISSPTRFPISDLRTRCGCYFFENSIQLIAWLPFSQRTRSFCGPAANSTFKLAFCQPDAPSAWS